MGLDHADQRSGRVASRTTLDRARTRRMHGPADPARHLGHEQVRQESVVQREVFAIDRHECRRGRKQIDEQMRERAHWILEAGNWLLEQVIGYWCGLQVIPTCGMLLSA